MILKFKDNRAINFTIVELYRDYRNQSSNFIGSVTPTMSNW